MDASRNDPCPCGSGRKYKKCCLKTDETHGRIPVTKEMKEILDRENERFKVIMGRDIGPNDPMLPSTLEFSEEEYKEHVSTMLREIDFDEAIIYAFNKTGFTMVKGKEHLLTSAQKKAWNDAIDEYYELQEQDTNADEEDLFILIEKLHGNLEKAKMVYSLILRHYSLNVDQISLSGNINLNDYVFFCITKTLKSIRAIGELLENFGEDAMNLTRTNFENYLEIIQAKYNPDNLLLCLRFTEGVRKGTHKKKGQFIFDLKTNEKVKPLTNFEKCKLNTSFLEEDTALYKYLYDYLSSYTHVDLRTANDYIDKDLGFSAVVRNKRTEALIFLVFINFLVLHELQEIPAVYDYKNDIIDIRNKIGDNLSELEQSGVVFPNELSIRLGKTIKTYR